MFLMRVVDVIHICILYGVNLFYEGSLFKKSAPNFSLVLYFADTNQLLFHPPEYQISSNPISSF